MERKRDRFARHAVFVLSAGALAGVLIWSKLRLVTNIPRSVYAVPAEDEDAGKDGDQTPVDSTPNEPGGLRIPDQEP